MDQRSRYCGHVNCTVLTLPAPADKISKNLFINLPLYVDDRYFAVSFGTPDWWAHSPSFYGCGPLTQHTSFCGCGLLLMGVVHLHNPSFCGVWFTSHNTAPPFMGVVHMYVNIFFSPSIIIRVKRETTVSLSVSRRPSSIALYKTLLTFQEKLSL